MSAPASSKSGIWSENFPEPVATRVSTGQTPGLARDALFGDSEASILAVLMWALSLRPSELALGQQGECHSLQGLVTHFSNTRDTKGQFRLRDEHGLMPVLPESQPSEPRSLVRRDRFLWVVPRGSAPRAPREVGEHRRGRATAPQGSSRFRTCLLSVVLNHGFNEPQVTSPPT